MDGIEHARLAAYTRASDEVNGRDRDSVAQRVWADVYEYMPEVAAALARYLRRLPEDWMPLLFAAETVDQVQPSTVTWPHYPRPDIAPFLDDEDCPACIAVQDMCRVHIGVERGVAHARSLLATAGADTKALSDLIARQHDLSAEPDAGVQPTAAGPARLAASLLALLGDDAQAWGQLEERYYDLANRRDVAAFDQAQGNSARAQNILEGKTWA
jgi:hypothetical protein